MAKNLLVINVDLRETRVALIENGIIAELHLERASTRSTLGNIVMGKVTRVLPGMQAAFIDIGQERAAFLHVEDLIRPDDFEAYLSGGKRPDEEENFGEAGENRSAGDEPGRATIDAHHHEGHNGAVPAIPLVGDSDDGDDDLTDEADEGEGDVEGSEAAEGTEGADAADETDADEADMGADEGEGGEELDDADEPETVELSADDVTEDDARDAMPAPIGVAGESEREIIAAPVVAVSAAGIASAVAVMPDQPPASAQPPSAGRAPAAPGAGRERDARGFRSKRSARSRGREGQKRNGKGRNAGRGGRPQRDASRLSRSTPIRDVVREGQEVIVQVSKEPIGTKGARVTSHISLPGRYVVYMPTLDQIGISKRIGSDKERARLREAIEALKPPTGGLIVRTVAEGLTKKQLKADVGYLVRLWEDVGKKRETGGKAPVALYQELDLVLKTARDLFTDDIEQIVIDDKEQYQRLVRFVEMFMPERAKDIVLYSGDEPIFDAYGIEDEIGRALSRKVPLPSGGYLIIDQAEALTAIDVNTGRYVGKGSKDLEDTLFKTNLEAVEEIAYQLRFRNLGGLIVLDLIDMERASNREKIRRRLEDLLQKDKAKTTLNRISDLGLIEMTRKRTRESLGRLLHEPCFYCDGTGQLQSKQTVVYEILRQIRRDRAFLPGYSVVVNAHPAVIDLMKGEERDSVTEAERRFMRRIELVPRKEYHLEQFDLAGK
ncbi:MAG TPA: Rne/Rng family ribonuclease [Polyangiaceae bacterium]|nr:Rne/Rng family ribonuclease [Polyangiaceae bacterium]